MSTKINSSKKNNSLNKLSTIDLPATVLMVSRTVSRDVVSILLSHRASSRPRGVSQSYSVQYWWVEAAGDFSAVSSLSFVRPRTARVSRVTALHSAWLSIDQSQILMQSSAAL